MCHQNKVGRLLAPSPLCLREREFDPPQFFTQVEDVAQVLQVLVHAVGFVDLAAAAGLTSLVAAPH